MNGCFFILVFGAAAEDADAHQERFATIWLNLDTHLGLNIHSTSSQILGKNDATGLACWLDS